MSVLALEAGTSGAAAGGAAAEGAGAGGASAGGGATVTPIRRGAGGAPSSPSKTLPSPRPPRPPSSPAAGRPSPRTSRAGSSGGGSQSRNQSPAQPGGQPRQSRNRGRSSGGRAHRGNYQPVILAEFIAAVLLVAISPVATKKNPAGLSPYDGQDMIKIGAVTGTYFLLALLSSAGQEAGRWAAWFGALILLAVGLNEAANVAKALNLAGLGGSATDSGDVTGTTQSGSTAAGRN